MTEPLPEDSAPGPPRDPDPDAGAASDTWEALGDRLDAALTTLDHDATPLEERLAAHATATRLLDRMEARLADAREATEAPDPSPPPGPESESYEALFARLSDTVQALEAEDAPLARAVKLHAEARLLASRCEAILKGAVGRLEEITRGAGETTRTTAAPEAPRRPPAPPEPFLDDVPF